MARGRFRPDVATWADIGPHNPLPAADPAFHDTLILAEGDSWFTIAGIPTSNLLFSMRFHRATLIVNCAMPGDTIEHMSRMANNRAYREALSPAGLAWDLILLSGGGNDLIDEAAEILLAKDARPAGDPEDPAAYCDPARLDRLVTDVQDGYRRLVALRDAPGSPARGVPILTHTYDYPTARNSPSRFLTVPMLGPWLFKAFTGAAIPPGSWNPLSDYLMDRLADGILDLARGPDALPAFHVIDTRHTLTRARPGAVGESGDWLNEIHPDFDGYAKLARVLEGKIAELIGG